VRVSIPKKSHIRKAERAEAAGSQKFSSNFHTDAQWAAPKIWVGLSRITYPRRREPNAIRVGNIWIAIRAYGDTGTRYSANGGECCSQSTVASNARATFRDLHSKVTNAVFYLANTGAAFVTCESYLKVASCGSGGVEASLAGRAPQSWFGALSLPAFAQPCMTLRVRPIFARPALDRRARKSGACRNHRSGMTSARRRGEGVGVDGSQKV
jgi:hypothetical protein